MKKIHVLLLLALAVCLALAGCAKEHTWVDANCESPKICSECGLTEGEPLGHTWQDANCENAKTCSVCAATEGEPLGHTWTDASCHTPKTCATCAATEGTPDPMQHRIVEGTVEEGGNGLVMKTGTCSICEEYVAVEFPDWESYIIHNLPGAWDYVYAYKDSTFITLLVQSLRFVINEDGTWECIADAEHESGDWEYLGKEDGSYLFALSHEGSTYYYFMFDEEQHEIAYVMAAGNLMLICEKTSVG